jgi:SET domain-containing protein
MIFIDYEIKTSSIHGAGLYTKQDIKKGTLIAKASPKLDLDISIESFNCLDDKEKQEILYWGFFDDGRNIYHVDFDNTKFINHKNNANVTQDMNYSDMYLVAKRDIKAGEELTQNYLEFETEEELKKRGIKND